LSKSLAIVFAFTLSCQHFEDIVPDKPVSVPPYSRSFFGSCFPADGAISIRWHQGAALILDSEAEWISDTYGPWEVQVTDPIGRSVLHISWKNRRLHVNGPLKPRIPDIEIKDDDFFEVGGALIGLKASEWPCLLKSDFPASWLEKIYRQENSSEGKKFYISEEKRKITLQTFDKPGPRGELMCALLEWKHLWGLKTTEIRWCQTSKSKSGFLDLPDSNRLTWNSIDA